MFLGFNRIIIIGLLGNDPEMRYTKSGIAVTTLNIAISEKRKVNVEWKTYTDWFNVICLGKSAENAGKFLKKGRQVLIEGKLQNRLWENKQGLKNVITEIIAKQIIFLGTQEGYNKEKNNTQKMQNTANAINDNEKEKEKNDIIYKNDIPF